MARVCVGCGLTTDIQGRLTVATGAWPFSCDLEDQGEDVYCSPVDGLLRVAPANLARTASTSGGISPGTITVLEGNTQTVDTMDITLTNPSSCYSARALVVFEADVHFVIPENGSALMEIAGNRYLRMQNQAADDLNTVSWQMSRTQVHTVAAGAALNLSVAIDVTASGSNIQYTDVNWRASAIIVSTQ